MSPNMFQLLIAAFVAAACMSGSAANICGAVGYETIHNGYYYDDSGSQGGYAACSQICLGDSKCASFAETSDTCILFSVAVAGNFEADNTSPEIFYDRSCIASTSTALTSSSSTHSTSSAS